MTFFTRFFDNLLNALKRCFLALKKVVFSIGMKQNNIQSTWFDKYDPGVPLKINIPNYPLSRFLDDAVLVNGDGPAIIYFGKKISYNQVNDAVNQVALGLQKLGISKGDRVALILPNMPQFVYSYWGILKLGAVVVLVNPLLSEREIRYQLENSGARHIITLDRIYPRIHRIKKKVNIKHVVVARIETFMPSYLRIVLQVRERLRQIEERIREGDDTTFFSNLLYNGHVSSPQIQINDPAVLLYTGGVTGRSKAAILSHKSLVANTLQARAWIPDFQDGKEVILAALPLIHSYGMTSCHHLAVQSKSILLLQPRFSARWTIKNISKYKVTIFPGVPTMYSAMLKEAIVKKADFSSLRACISGGAPLPPAIKDVFQDLTKSRLVEGYGLTEASPITHCNPIYGKNKSGSIGLPWPGTEARVVHLKTRKIVPCSTLGELEVRGPQIMSEYWKNIDETHKVINRDGWLKTGDIAKYDNEGYFYIVDRKKMLSLLEGITFIQAR